MEIYDGDSFQEDEVSFETFYKIVSSRTEKHQELQNLVQSWIEERPNVCLLTVDHQRIFCHAILLSLHSRMLMSVLSHQERQFPTAELSIISLPVNAKPVRNLLRLLIFGVTISGNLEDLKETEKTAKVLGINLKETKLRQVKVPHSDIYSYCKPPLSVKVDTNKENIVDMVADVSTLDILDEEIKVIDESQQSKDNEETLFPDYGKFKSKIFHERIKVLTDSGAKISKVVGEKYLRNHEYDESFPNFEPKDGSTSSQSEMSVPVVERRTSKRKLFVQENPELFDDEEVSTWSNDEANNSFKNFCVECESRRHTSSLSSKEKFIRSPKTPVQRELYNNCEDCMKRRAEENIKNIKQRKYFQMLKDKRSEAERFKGQKFPCNKCDYVAAIPSNLKTHQLAKHEGENFVDNYVSEYFQKNKFLIL